MRIVSCKLPFGKGRLFAGIEPGDGEAIRANALFTGHLSAKHFSKGGILLKEYDLGSGLVTNVGVLSMANDFAWASPSGAAINTLKLANQHSSGTGATAAATTDIKLQIPITTIGAPVVAGVQTLVSAANLQKYQTVATISYNAGGPFSVTEWGLFSSGTLTATTGSPFTATSATGGTVTGTPLTASSATVQGQQANIFETTTTPRWGLVLTNSTSAIVIPAWYVTADGTAGSTPGATETYTIRPVMWDHRVFGVITVNNGDTIQFTYLLTVQSGG